MASARTPRIDRPEPSLYFMDETEGSGLLPWSHVDREMEQARNYWVATSGPGGRPHCMPVWGVWSDRTLVFSTSARSRKARNLDARPYAAVHLESGDRVVVVEGPVATLDEDVALEAFVAAYNPKYDWDFSVERVREDRVYAVRAAKAFAWLGSEGEAFAGTATRFVLEGA
jgi:hypothetical protein